jgi:hypothetical protein
VPILKKLCVYKNLDRLFYVCVNNIRSGYQFFIPVFIDNSLVNEVIAGGFPRIIFEELKISLSPAIELSLNSNTCVKLSDVIQYSRIRALEIEEFLSVSSASEINLRSPTQIVERISLESEAELRYLQIIEASESIVVSDVLSAKLVKTLAESVRVTSSPSLRERFNASLTVRVSDSLSYVAGVVLNASLSMNVSDSVSKTFKKSLSELLSVNSTAYISVSEPPRGAG